MTGLFCAHCNTSFRQMHWPAQCERCGTNFCRVRRTHRFCSAICRYRAAASPNGRVAQEWAVLGWRMVGEVPAGAPDWLKSGVKS